jgi:hypothetical protein
MDLGILIASIMCVYFSLLYFGERDYFRANCLLSIGIFLAILLTVVIIEKQPNITYNAVKDIEGNGENYQIISVGNTPLNINKIMGRIYKEGDIIKVERYSEVWSMGIIFCIIGQTVYSHENKEVEE